MPINKVLIVEDDRAQLLHMQQIVSDAGYITTVAMNGADGVERAKADRPDAILMDINMPGMDGFAAIRLLKKDETTKNIPVVFVSSKNQKADMVWAKMQGSAAYISKPFAHDEIVTVLKQLG
jgi:twitching motility two-component system response regulator PilH